MEQDVAILDFGSDKVTVMVAGRGINNTINVKGTGVCYYSGFRSDVAGMWLEPRLLPSVLLRAINDAEKSSRTKIHKIYVGVPGDFTACVYNSFSFPLDRRRKITFEDVDVLKMRGNPVNENPDYEIINIQPIYYTLDDERKIDDPIDKLSTRLGGKISYIFAKRKEFLDIIRDAFRHMQDMEEPEFISSVLAESVYLFDDALRDNGCILINTGFATTTVSVLQGDGILNMYAFDFGGESITEALVEKFDILREYAEELKREAIVTLEPASEEKYCITINHEPAEFNQQEVNAIIKEKLINFAYMISETLKLVPEPLPPSIPYSLSGNGIAAIHGAVGFLSEILAHDCEKKASSQPRMYDLSLSSALGLADLVLNVCVSQPTLWQKIVSKFSSK